MSAESSRVVIFDTTMRDGEQSPGAAMTLDDKVELGALLDSMGVDVIEAGFPAASNGDFDAVRAVGAVLENAVLCGLCARRDERHRTLRRSHTRGQALPHPHLHLHFADPPQAQAQYGERTRFSTPSPPASPPARNHTDDVEWSAEDATRTERDFLRRCVEAAIRAGATTINIPDTVGYSYPGRIPRHLRRPDRQCSRRRRGDFLRPLPQRSGPGGGQFAGRGARRRPADRVRDQRPWRTRRQRGA